MKIDKEYYEAGDICIIYSKSYYSNLDKFIDFFKIAKKDFPDLTEKDIKIVRFGGRFKKGIFGIEFKVKKDKQNLYNYTKIKFFDPT